MDDGGGSAASMLLPAAMHGLAASPSDARVSATCCSAKHVAPVSEMKGDDGDERVGNEGSFAFINSHDLKEHIHEMLVKWLRDPEACLRHV